MTNCPRCHSPLRKNHDDFLRGRTVLVCFVCRKLTSEVDGVVAEWVDGGPGWLERLKATVGEQEHVRDIRSSDDDDPRWQRIII